MCVDRQHVLDQLQNSGINAALIAPQFAVDALDSSAGRFWVPGAFAQFMAEASMALAKLWGSRSARIAFAALPIILVAYSGGYNPAAYVLTLGGVGKRVRGVILLDALVAEDDKFAAWIAASRRLGIFLLRLFGSGRRRQCRTRAAARRQGHRLPTGLPQSLVPGGVSLVETAGVDHDDYMTNAWVTIR